MRGLLQSRPFYGCPNLLKTLGSTTRLKFIHFDELWANLGSVGSVNKLPVAIFKHRGHLILVEFIVAPKTLIIPIKYKTNGNKYWNE